MIAEPGTFAPALPLPPAAPVSLESVGRLLRGLDRDQRRAVTHREGPLLIVAGPGTGKTHVITRRIAWLVATKRARPEEILALTFTDRAAQEMQARVDELVPYGHADAAIHTYHALGDRLVRELALELGVPSDLRLMDRAGTIVFLRERLFQLGLERYRPLADPTRFLDALATLISRAKDEDVSPADYGRYARALAARAETADPEARAPLREEASAHAELASAYERVTDLMLAAGCMDFGDQVVLALRALRERASVRATVQRRYRYVLVDEFQDTNVAQWELVRLIAGGPRPDLTVVGDDDQSIYTFRGAALSNIMGFGEAFPDARRVVLRRNHRSRAPILDAARRLIRHNDPQRLEIRLGVDKSLRAHRRGPRALPVRELVFRTPGEEADAVAGTIAERVAAGARPWEFAILLRTNRDAEPFLRSLNVAGVPWRFSGAGGLYARPEVRELLAFLRVVAEPGSSVDLYAVATGEPYRLGGPDLSAILELARRRHRSLWETLLELEAQPGTLRLAQGCRAVLRRLLGDLRASIELAHRRPAGEVLYDHLKRSGRLERLTAAATMGDDGALDAVARLFQIVREQSALLREDRVPFLVRHLQTLIDAGDRGEAPDAAEPADAVSVLTVHKAKGLEFPVVFLGGLFDGRFPTRGRVEALPLPAALCRRLDPAAGEEATHAEERRLCYVAMTRARDELVLTYAERSPGGRARRPSPFIAEALDRPSAPGAADPGAMAPVSMRDALMSHAAPGPARAAAATPAASGPLDLSYSQVDDYLACPRRYQLRHVLHVPTPPHHALGYGNALHQAVAAFHLSEARGVPLSEAQLLDAFAAHWTGEGSLSRDHEEARFAAGQETLRRFRRERLAQPGCPVAVERPFSFRLGEDRIRGRYDRVDETPAGTVITDYKSSDVRDQERADRRARESLQLAIYAMAHAAETGALPAAVELHFLDSGVVGRAPLDEKRLDRARRKVAAAAQGIRTRDFTAAPDPVTCGYCPFRGICASSAA